MKTVEWLLISAGAVSAGAQHPLCFDRGWRGQEHSSCCHSCLQWVLAEQKCALLCQQLVACRRFNSAACVSAAGTAAAATPGAAQLLLFIAVAYKLEPTAKNCCLSLQGGDALPFLPE
jgi:hypothetical protein